MVLVLLAFALLPLDASEPYFPPPDVQGGWRTLQRVVDIRSKAGLDPTKLDKGFDYAKTTSKHGGLLVASHGWLAYERYFGRGHRDATPNLGSCGKAVTSLAMGVLLAQRPDLFPDGLDQKIFTPRYFPPEAFPLSDPARADIRLGQLLSMTAGIRGNNPGYVRGKQVTLDPPGPDGWEACVDSMALGKIAGKLNTDTLWCKPGEGYSYATSSPHLVSIIIRHLTGMELETFVGRNLAERLGWGRWGWGTADPQ